MVNKKTLFCIITGLFWFSQYGYAPHISNYAKELGASYKIIGIISGVYGISQTILRLPLGVASDILNRRKIFINFGFLASITSAVLVVVYPGVYTLLVSRFLTGVAVATWVNFTVMFSAYFNDSESVRASGIINSANKIGQFLAILIGGFIVLRLSIAYTFIICAIAGVIGYVLSLFLKDQCSIKENTQFKFCDLFLIVKNKNILYISFLNMFVQLITYGTTYGFTPLIASNLGANNFQISMITLAYIFPQIFFSTLAGTVISKKIGENGTLFLGSIIITITCILTPFSTSLFMLYCIQAFSGIGFALTFPLLMGLAIKSTEPRLRNTAMGFFQSILGVGIIIGPMLLGFIGDEYGLIPAYFNTALLGIICIMIILVLKKKEEKIVK